MTASADDAAQPGVLESAAAFIYREARLLDRLRFERRFGRGSRNAVRRALLEYQNEDGGFGNGLEPDIRGAASQPVPLEHALQILDEVDFLDSAVVEAACDWLNSVTTADGGVPFVLPSVAEGPHASWWVPSSEPSLNPTAGIAGLLHKSAVDHPWLDRATAFCWDALDRDLATIGPDDAVSVLTFLEHVPDRNLADRQFARLGERIVSELVALDPDTPGYVKTPLDFAPRPDAPARVCFDDATIDRHLDALAARQQDDGGWPITWEPPSAAAVSEWRGFMTLKWLDVLANYGRLSPQGFSS